MLVWQVPSFRLAVVGAAVSGCVADPLFVGAGGAGGAGGATSAASSSSDATTAASSSSSTASSAATTASAGGSGGEGGGCELPPVAPCGGFSDDFSAPLVVPGEWIRHGAAANFTLMNDELVVHMTASAQTMYLETAGMFPFSDCAVWARVVQPAEPVDIITRISVGPFDMNNVYNIGVANGLLLARQGDMVLAMTAYDPMTMRYVRLRADADSVHFGHSIDAACWSEIHTESMSTVPIYTGRLVLEHIMAVPGSVGDGVFDDYNVTP